MAVKEKGNSHGNKKLEYLNQNNKPELHEVKVHLCILKAVPFLFTSALAAPIHKDPWYQTTQLTPWLFRGKGVKVG